MPASTNLDLLSQFRAKQQAQKALFDPIGAISNPTETPSNPNIPGPTGGWMMPPTPAAKPLPLTPKNTSPAIKSPLLPNFAEQSWNNLLQWLKVKPTGGGMMPPTEEWIPLVNTPQEQTAPKDNSTDPMDIFGIPKAYADWQYSEKDLKFLQTMKDKWESFEDAMKMLDIVKQGQQPQEQSTEQQKKDEPTGVLDAMGNILSESARNTKEAFMWGIGRVQEAGEWLANGKYSFPEAAARGWLWAVEAATSPVAWVASTAVKHLVVDPITWLTPKSVKNDISQNIVQPAAKKITDWYNKLPDSAKRDAENAWIAGQLLLNFAGAKAAPEVWNAVKEWGLTLKQTASDMADAAASKAKWLIDEWANKLWLGRTKSLTLKVGETPTETTLWQWVKQFLNAPNIEKQAAEKTAKTLEYITPESKPGLIKKLNPFNTEKKAITETWQWMLWNTTKILPDANIPWTHWTLQQIAEATSEDIEPLQTVSQNSTNLNSWIAKTWNQLRSEIAANNPVITRDSMGKIAEDALNKIADDPEMVWESELQANKMINKWKTIVKNTDENWTWLLDARQKFDAYMNEYSPSDIGKKSIKNTVWKAIRNASSDALEAATPENVNVKALLRKQSLKYDALDLIKWKEDINLLWKILKNPLTKKVATWVWIWTAWALWLDVLSK